MSALSSLILYEGSKEYHSDIPLDFVTGTGADPRPRMRVEEGSTGFFEGREFRMFVEFSIPAGQEIWVRHTITKNFILHDQRITIESSGVRWSAVAATSSSPGPWTAATFRRRNQMAEQPSPFYVSGSTIEVSSTPGAATGGFEVDVMRITAGQGAGSSTATQNAGLRGLAPGVYHARLQNTGNSTCVGVYDWWWEEREPRSPLIYGGKIAAP
ncbi:MAG TPA: hypothetical protein VM783_18035 [Candidatus Acidoferrum sp.]|nr:hypothetical protein [Candidatus Acidoferrum sp.]